MLDADPIRVVLIERNSSINFLHTAFRCYADSLIAMSIDVGAPKSFPGISVVDSVLTGSGGGWFTDRFDPRHDNAAAQVVRTSGSTGEPKAILLSHRALGDVATRLVDFMALDDSVREYVGIPVTYSFGFGRIRAVAAAGGASFLPERGFRIDEFAAMLERGEVNALSAVPTLLRVVLNQRERFSGLGSRLKWLEIGSQAMTPAEKEAVRVLFPNARIIQHYGLTEASRTTFLDVSGEDNDALGSVGRPYGKVELKITEDGQIAVRGPHVADGIITAAGIQTLTDTDGWLRTNDLGHMRDGLTFFDGRADDLINVGGIKVPSEIFEDRLRAAIGTRLDYAVAPGSDPLRGQRVVVSYDKAASPGDVEQLRTASAQVAREMGVADSVAHFAVDAIPRTQTNKVQRKQITAQYDASRSRLETQKENSAEAPKSPAEGIAAAFAAKFGDGAQDQSASFRTLEGDSLSYVDMMLQLERFLPDLPEDWDTWTIAELCRKADPKRQVEDAFIAMFGGDALDAGASFESLGGDEAKQDRLRTQLQAAFSVLPDDWRNMSIGALSSLAGSQPQASARTPSSKGYRPANLDTVRGLACVLIVALHVLGVRSGTGLEVPRPSTWHAIMDAIQVVRLPLFTALAGYIYGAMPATRDGFWPFMRTKLKQLAVPVIFLTAVFWTLRYAVFGERAHSLLMTYVLSYEHLWYLYSLLLMFAVVSLIDAIVRPSVLGWIATIAAAMVLYAIMPAVEPGYIKNGLLYLPFFLLGVVIQRNSAWIRSPVVTVLALICLVGAISTIPLGTPEAIATETPALRTWLGGAGAVVLALLYVPKFSGLELLAAYSFTIYLWHPIASSAMRTLLWKLGIENIPLLFMAGLAAGLLMPVALHLVALRLPRFLSMPVIGK